MSGACRERWAAVQVQVVGTSVDAGAGTALWVWEYLVLAVQAHLVSSVR